MFPKEGEIRIMCPPTSFKLLTEALVLVLNTVKVAFLFMDL